jgi:hypothetical protein
LKQAAIRYALLTVILPLFFFIGAKPVSGEKDVLKLDEALAVKLMLDEINGMRADAGLDPVELDTELSVISRAYSRDMAERDFFGHYDPDGQGANDRVREAGLRCLVTENVGVYRSDSSTLVQTVSDLMNGFYDSGAHRANILDPDATHIGIGFYQDSTGLSTIFRPSENRAPKQGYGTIFVTQNYYRLEIYETQPSILPAEVIAGVDIELNIKTVTEFDMLSLHFEKQDFFSEEYYVKAERGEENEYSCRWRFPENGQWTCRVIGVTDPERGLARGIGQMGFVVE